MTKDVAQAGTGDPTAINISPFNKIQVELVQWSVELEKLGFRVK